MAANNQNLYVRDVYFEQTVIELAELHILR